MCWPYTTRRLRSSRHAAWVDARAGQRELGRCRCWHSSAARVNAVGAAPCRAEFDARGSRAARASFGQNDGTRRTSASGASAPAAATSRFLQLERWRAARGHSCVELSPIGAAAGCFWSGSASKSRAHASAGAQRGALLGLPRAHGRNRRFLPVLYSSLYGFWAQSW